MRGAVAMIGLLIWAGTVEAQLAVEDVGVSNMPTDVSSNGTVVVGNIYGSYETFYWTSETGALPLGRATVPVLGVGAGTPDVSADGTKVSATVLTDDSHYATQGVWDIAQGWQTLMPPPPADGGILDQSYGSAWGLSGDGETVVGLYWTQTGGDAHPSAGSPLGGVHNLGVAVAGHSGRANAANYDGSVVGGWTEQTDGTWEPTVWVDGVMTLLGHAVGTTQVHGVNSAGTVLVGQSYEYPYPGATIWRWNGSAWDWDDIGVLPGTGWGTGLAWFDSVSDDGSVVVGGNRWAFSPVYAGMLWTPDTGLILADDWVAGLGAATPFPIIQLTAVSQDGKTVVGIVQNESAPYELAGVVLRCVSDGDADGDGDVDLQDAALLQQAYTGAGAGALTPGSEPLDMNCDLDIDGHDVAEFVGRISGPT